MPKLRKLFTSLKSKNGSKNQAPVENAGDQDPRKKNASSGRDITSIASGPDPKPENKKSRKKIIASYKDAAVILKQQGFDLKSQNEKALCWACENGEQEAIQLLLQLGTEIRTVRSGSPLHAAAGYGDCQIVQDLLNRGAYIMARLDSNDTALHSATRRGKFGMVEFLLNEGADVHAGGNFGLSALHIAARCGLEFIVRLLLEYGADLEATDNSNRTPLHHAAINDKFDMVMQLIKLGANSEARDNKGLAPIHLAGEAGHERTFEMLQTESKKVKAQKRQKKRGERLSSQECEAIETRDSVSIEEHETSYSAIEGREPRSPPKYKQESRILGVSPAKNTEHDEREKELGQQAAGNNKLKPLETKYERETGYIHPMILRWD